MWNDTSEGIVIGGDEWEGGGGGDGALEARLPSLISICSHNLGDGSRSTGEVPLPLHGSDVLVVVVAIRETVPVPVTVQVLLELSVFIVGECLLAAASRRLGTRGVPAAVGAAEAHGDEDEDSDDDDADDEERQVEGVALEGLEEGRCLLGRLQLVA